MPNPKSCRWFPPPFLFFPACIYRQPGERFAIPCLSAGHGSLSHFSSIMLAGYGCVGMGHAGFLGKWGGEREKENSGKQRFKIFFFPASACAGKKENSAKTTLFRLFFKRMKTNLGVTQKWVMTTHITCNPYQWHLTSLPTTHQNFHYRYPWGSPLEITIRQTFYFVKLALVV